jgi:hypothetical protein
MILYKLLTVNGEDEYECMATIIPLEEEVFENE